MFPQFNVMTVDHLLGAFPSGGVVSTVEVDSFDGMAVTSNKGMLDSAPLPTLPSSLGGSLQYSLSPIIAVSGAMMQSVCSGFVFITRSDGT